MLLNKPEQTNKIFTITLFFMSILLHQANIIFNMNISFADLFCLLLFILIAARKKIYLPILPSTFYIIVVVVTLMSAIFFVPIKFSIFASPKVVINDFIKLLAIFLYFLVGYSLATAKQMERVLKWYSLIGMLIGLMGVIFTLLNIRLLSSVLFYSNIRFRGFMNDPNYFAILQITSLVYFSRLQNMKIHYKVLAIVITVLAVLVSGSKTGIITLLCYLAIRFLENMFISKKKLKTFYLQLLTFLLLCIFSLLFVHLFFQFLNSIVNVIPAFARISNLFTDFEDSISGSGSHRGTTWRVASQIIQESPLIGIGIGTYTYISSEWFSSRNIAHNTYLQLSAEWGLPLAVTFFSFIIYLLVKTSRRISLPPTVYMLRDIVFIFLFSSMAISLNNSRLLWIVLGALVYFICYQRSHDEKYKLKV